jgi:hypothetical protein
MSSFPHKKFEGVIYTFEHLKPIRVKVPLNAQATLFVDMHVEFGCHCFTEDFDQQRHRPDHRYQHRGELRAFDTERYACSLQLPRLIEAMQKGMIYNADESYTYAARIPLDSARGVHSYSIFFSLKKDLRAKAPALKMFVKSAYLKPLVARPNAQKWRFVSLAGQIAGVFENKKKPKPEKQKKKAPQGLLSVS